MRCTMLHPRFAATLLLALLVWAAQASAEQASLTWDPVNAPTVAGYRIYYSLTRSTYTAYIDVGLATTATVTGLTAGQTYYFVATAYDATGNESGPSNTVTVSLPSAVPSAPMLVLSVNTPSVRTGDALTLTAVTTLGPTPATADLYIALQPPGCSAPSCLLFWQGGLNFTTFPQPVAHNWPISPFNGQIFSYTFGGTEPVGSYTWLGVFTVAGTVTYIGEITQAPFTFSP